MAIVTATRIAEGTYCVEHEGKQEIVYVAGPANDRWIFWNGRVFRGDFRVEAPAHATPRQAQGGQMSLTAPMPARVIKISAQQGAPVKKGDSVVVLEAMKMELPVRAPDDGVVTAVHCREGELVDAEAVLVDLAPANG